MGVREASALSQCFLRETACMPQFSQPLTNISVSIQELRRHDETTRSRIRDLFLSAHPSFDLAPAADVGRDTSGPPAEIDDGAIVAVSTSHGERVPRGELIAAAMRVWEQPVIEEALGDEAALVLPEAIRLVDLPARVPRYQREVLHALARRERTSVGEIVRRHLEDLACAHAAEVPGVSAALGWPESGQ
jgi:hypothetical protein